MAKFRFNLTAGCLLRSDVRNQLYRSKEKLEYAYPGSFVSIREEKSFFESIFYIQGTNFPDTDDFYNVIKNWEMKIRSISDN